MATVDDLSNPKTTADEEIAPPDNIPTGTSISPWGALRLTLKRVHIRDEYLIASIILLAIGISLAIVFLRQAFFDAINLSTLGYAGVFVFTFLGAATIFLPSGGGAVIILSGAILNPFIIGLLAGLGGSLGELTGYFIGYQGGMVLEKRAGLYARAKRWMRRRGSITIFVLSVVPNPLFDAAGLAAGGIRFPLKKFLLLVWVGKTIQATAGALIGAWGPGQLSDLAEGILG